MNIKNLTDEALSQKLTAITREEREVTVTVLHHLREAERRRLFAAHGYPSLFAYCVEKLGYCEGSAQRRISSMRLLKEIPEVEESLAQGTLSLSVVSKAQSFFKQEGVETPQEKREVLRALSGKSSRQAERELASRAKNPKPIKPERVRPVSESMTRLEITVPNSVLEQLEELRGLLAHRELSTADAVELALNLALEKLRPKAPESAKESVPPTSAVKRSRFIPAQIKREVWKRDGGRCVFVHPETGKKCGTKHRLNYDHIHPYAQGGENTVENLRLYCFQHNQWAARAS